MALIEISDREESESQMYVIVSIYRAKAGEEDAIIALHEDWQSKQGTKAKVYLSWELLRNTEAHREFITISYFEREELPQRMMGELNQESRDFRPVRLTA